MRDRHIREEADAKRLIKKGLTLKPYLYQIPESGKRFEYVVVENNLSERVGDKIDVVGLCARFINYNESYHLSTETILKALKKLKDGKK
ncbi:19691_t:CDS:2, partial [Funneliformis geosporum]